MTDKETANNEYSELSYASAKALDVQILRQELTKRGVNSKGAKKTLLNRVKYYNSRGWPSTAKKSSILGIKRKIEEMDLNGTKQTKTEPPTDEPPTKKRQLNDKSDVPAEPTEIKQEQEQPTPFEQEENDKEEEKRDVVQPVPEPKEGKEETIEKQEQKEEVIEQNMQQTIQKAQDLLAPQQVAEHVQVMDVDDEKPKETSISLSPPHDMGAPMSFPSRTNDLNDIEQEQKQVELSDNNNILIQQREEPPELLTPQPLAFPGSNINNTNEIEQIEPPTEDKENVFNNLDIMDIEEPIKNGPMEMDQLNDEPEIISETPETTISEPEESITLWNRLENCHSDSAINELERTILNTIELSLKSINMSNDIITVVQDMCKFRFVKVFDPFDINKATEDEKELVDEFYGTKFYRLKKIPKYFRKEWNYNEEYLPQFGDIIRGNMRLSDSYWVDIDGQTLIYSEDEMNAGYMQIPYEITQHMRDACIFYKTFWNKKAYENLLVYITSITVRSDEYDLINNIFDNKSVKMLKKIGLPQNKSYTIGCDQEFKKLFFDNDIIDLDQIKRKPSLCFDNNQMIKIVKT